MLTVIRATLRTLSRPMSGSASISPTSASPNQVDGLVRPALQASCGALHVS
jgi:hypothetical protein